MIGQTTIYLEELGKAYGVNLVVEAEYCLSKGHRETQYEPASDDSFEFFKATVTSVYNDKFVVDRKEAPDWFEGLDELALKTIQRDDRHEQRIWTELAEDQMDWRW